MSIMRFLATQRKRSTREDGFLSVRQGATVAVQQPDAHMHEARTGETGSSGSKKEMAQQMNIDSQLAQMQAMSLQHYPKPPKSDDEQAALRREHENAPKRLEYLNGLYEQRLREFAAMVVRLEVRE